MVSLVSRASFGGGEGRRRCSFCGRRDEAFGPSGLARTGHAVRVDEEWKVSRDTWCELVSMVGVQYPAPED